MVPVCKAVGVSDHASGIGVAPNAYNVAIITLFFGTRNFKPLKSDIELIGFSTLYMSLKNTPPNVSK